jgi:hypothetical protein
MGSFARFQGLDVSSKGWRGPTQSNRMGVSSGGIQPNYTVAGVSDGQRR